MSVELTKMAGGVAAAGFRVAGVRCGIKRKRRDICLLVSETNAAVSAAGVFTTNVVRAPCVDWSESRLAQSGTATAIVVNAGNANAGNGDRGETDNAQMAQWAADALGVPVETVLTASTGVIGTPLPMALIAAGIKDAAARLVHSPEAASEAAEAIMTTDTFTKEYAVRFVLPSGTAVTIGGMSKGSGMIAPNMATMLGFVTTDATIAPNVLRTALVEAVAESFNCLTVDGDTSTNDSCIVMASGMAENPPIDRADTADYCAFADALTHVCVHLAKEIARDGEGATKLVTVRVSGAASVTDARKIAKTIAESPLVKTALFGNDPNWGRILAAAGRAGVRFDPKQTTAYLAGVCIFAHGSPTVFDAPALSQAMKVKELTIHVDIGAGDAEAHFYTCDFSYDYIRINAEYHT
ncbi:MAG: bifunctional glutamate N-acetyltransferase/amino-acid acetyltransferase ArgJ [Armatimonadetes bacterium]|nr:bifunctional glutamate N-acetyltransferase/amino-acid acetyltransferase ArgJ [Armatimonadota bacterium]